LPSIVDADHRGLTADPQSQQDANTRIPPGMAHDGTRSALTSRSAPPTEILAAATLLLQCPTDAKSTKGVGPFPRADPLTKTRARSFYSPSTNLFAGPYPAASRPHVVTRGNKIGHSSQAEQTARANNEPGSELVKETPPVFFARGPQKLPES